MLKDNEKPEGNKELEERKITEPKEEKKTDKKEESTEKDNKETVKPDSEKQLLVCTPYGYAYVDIDKLKVQLDEEAKKNIEVRKVIQEFVKEKELALDLELSTKEKEEEL